MSQCNEATNLQDGGLEGAPDFSPGKIERDATFAELNNEGT